MENINKILSFEIGKCKIREPFVGVSAETIYETLSSIQKAARTYISFFEENLDLMTTEIDSKIKAIDSINLLKGSIGNIFNYFIESDRFRLVDYNFTFDKRTDARVFVYKQIINCDHAALKDILRWHEKLAGVRCIFLHTQLLDAVNEVRELVALEY